MMTYDSADMRPELSFIVEFDLNRNGMIAEIETEFNIIRMCLTQLNELSKDYVPMIDRVLVMPLRKLLCDKNSVLLKVIPNLKLPPIIGQEIEWEDGLKIIRPNLVIAPQENWISINKWRNQKIAWFERSASDLPCMFPAFVYMSIIDKLNRLLENKKLSNKDKCAFESLFEIKTITYKGSEETVYMRVDTADTSEDAFIFSTLKKIGYYDLNIYNFLKHLSNKRGAHIDIGHSRVIELVNSPITEIVTPTTCIALQTIWAVKHQVPELANYWPEMELPQV